MLELFTALTEMLYTSWWLALLSSFIWGILSIILSPCHLATIPLIVGFINDREDITKKKAAFLSTLFAFGILITLGIIGVATGLMGRILGDIGGYGNYLIGVLLILFGIYLLDVIKLPFLMQCVKPTIKKKGALSAFLVGLIFGVALGPCAFAFLAPMLGIVFSTASSNIILALFLLFFFALGHCTVIILAGTFTEVVRQFLNWNEKSKGTLFVKRICGVLVILAGFYLILITSFNRL